MKIIDLTQQMYDRMARKYGEGRWEDALNEARKYVHRKREQRFYAETDYDEDGAIFDSFHQSVRDALWYLTESGEVS